MDITKFGLRSIIGYVFPGAAFLLILAFTLYATLFPILNLVEHIEFKRYSLFLLNKLSWEGSILLTILLFLLSYVIGSIFRLYSADNVDIKSSKRLFYPPLLS